jgi:uncharacterized repeat protein (TIGR01451 family)
MTFVRVITNIIVNKTVNNTNPNYLENITWTINVKNLGPDNATNVKVTELLPDGLTYIKHTTNNGTYNSTTGLWNIGNVNVDETATLIIITQVTKDSHNIINTVNVTSTEKDWNMTNNVYNLTIVPNSTDLSIKKELSNANPYIGDTIT